MNAQREKKARKIENERVLLGTGFGRRDVVEHLIGTGADVHARDDGGLIPLHNACSFGHAEVVQLLLRAGADPNARDNWNYTPLHEAAIKGKVDVCVVLLQHGADHEASPSPVPARRFRSMFTVTALVVVSRYNVDLNLTEFYIESVLIVLIDENGDKTIIES